MALGLQALAISSGLKRPGLPVLRQSVGTFRSGIRKPGSIRSHSISAGWLPGGSAGRSNSQRYPKAKRGKARGLGPLAHGAKLAASFFAWAGWPRGSISCNKPALLLQSQEWMTNILNIPKPSTVPVPASLRFPVLFSSPVASIATGSRRSKTQKLFRFGHFGIPFL